MRIAVDARELEGHATGVGRVVAGLLEAWPADDDIVLISRRAVELPSSHARLRPDVTAGPAWMPGSVWEQSTLPARVRQHDVDALICPGYGMPLASPVPTAVCMHDCAFASVPGTFRARERWRRTLQARIAARRAAFLFMGSQFAADEAVRHLHVAEARAVVLPWGVSPRFRPPPAADIEALRSRLGIRGPAVLFVGARLQRRQLPMLAAVVGRLADTIPGVRLLVAGEAPAAERLDEVGGEHVRWLGWIDEGDLPALYAAATAVAYPSTYEGFGLPVLEAMACGTPVVASDCTAPAEVFREYARLVAPDDEQAWEDALRTLLTDGRERQRRAEAASQWAWSRTWDAAAAGLRRRLAAEAGP